MPNKSLSIGSKTQRLLRCKLLGVGAMRSPRYAPAGLLVEHPCGRVMIDGGLGAEPDGTINRWVVTDERAELIGAIRQLAHKKGCSAEVSAYIAQPLVIEPKAVRHTSHPTFGYRIRVPEGIVAWAPEFLEFPRWAAHATLLFADAAGWDRPIWFVGKVGGHACALDVSRKAKLHGVRRLVFAHVGRPTLRAMDRGLVPAFGEFGQEGDLYYLSPGGQVRRQP
jgi:hypothetical protein